MTYGDENFKEQKKIAMKMAKKRGDFDRIIDYSPKHISDDFYNKNKNILMQKRGGGYWLWKPYFINETLKKMDYEDYLFYSDSGVCFLKNVDLLIEELKQKNQDIMVFELPLIESQWTKKELFINMNLDKEKYYGSNQILASFMLIKKTNFSVKFYKEFLDYSCNELNITDKFDKKIKQRTDFIDHRHDQSIFSLLCKKYNLKTFKDPTQLGKYPRGYSGSLQDNLEKGEIHILENKRKFFMSESLIGNYEEVLFHYRKSNPYIAYFKYKIKEILYKIGIYKGLIR